MTNEQILKKAIEKARKNSGAFILSDSWFSANCDGWKDFMENEIYYRIIFSHDFAKAFWGETREGECRNPNCECHKINPELKMCCNDCRNVIVGWKQSLQLMVLEKEPLQYLKKYL